MYTSIVIISILLAVLGPPLKSRYDSVVFILKRRPDNLPSVSSFDSFEIKFEESIRNCEDVYMNDEDGFAVLSCDPGRDNWNTVMGTKIDPQSTGGLYLYNYADPEATPVLLNMVNFPKDRDFHPLGLDLNPGTNQLIVASHASQGSGLEIFELDRKSMTLNHRHTLMDPRLPTPNAVRVISDYEVLVTNDHYFRIHQNPWLALAETYLAVPGGTIARVNLLMLEVATVARVPFANGIALLNSSHVAVASTSTPEFRVYEMHSMGLNLTMSFATPFMPDNLNTDSAGRLLIAGHAAPGALGVVAKTNHQYDLDGKGVEGKAAPEQRPRAPSWVTEWDGNMEGEMKDLYLEGLPAEKGGYGCSSSATRDVGRGVGIITGLYEKGILVFKTS
ncbi:calcium-dependent phosphotriesterase [Aulographum hederae CBS 113979]|uniref:Calcium-dependent phosphotriesterase n=1 Tax=Aulographum hederae CBS 113979 TaxID=1176131 RepID=A0A6G1H2B5_9PEZI|nr:calcium-dependent phosphotriesterase [Aulographum hederae CBS 113979]